MNTVNTGLKMVRTINDHVFNKYFNTITFPLLMLFVLLSMALAHYTMDSGFKRLEKTLNETLVLLRSK